MQIEVGKRYRTRGGDVVEIIRRSNNTAFDSVYPFAGITHRGHFEFYAPDGSWHIGMRGEYDLIEELPADATE